MKTLTVDQLLKAIREADSIENLKRRVGPSEIEERKALRRLEQLDELWNLAERNGWGYDPERWPFPRNETYRQISEEQRNYENQYC